MSVKNRKTNVMKPALVILSTVPCVAHLYNRYILSKNPRQVQNRFWEFHFFEKLNKWWLQQNCTKNATKRNSETAETPTNPFYKLLLHKSLAWFSNLFRKLCVMEMRNEKGNEKRRRKIVQKNAVLVRSVRANQSSTLVWEKEHTATHQIWKN